MEKEKVEMPLSVNIIKFQNYLLAPDEVVLFEWFIVKSISFKYDEFYYGQQRIENETRIKRTRQDKIINYFSDFGIIRPQVRKNATGGSVRHFYIDFECLCDKKILSEFINPESVTKFIQYFKYHFAEQKKNAKKKPQEIYFDKQKVDNLYNLLNRTYRQRVEKYNKGKKTGLKSIVQMPQSKRLDDKLLRLSEIYDTETIENAFIAYVDKVLSGDETPNGILNYFLTYDLENKEWGVFNEYLNYFTANYSYTTS